MTTKTAEPQVRVALTSFIGAIGKAQVEIREGDLYAANDPAVEKWPERFAPVAVRSSGARVEAATAAPGEKRGA